MDEPDTTDELPPKEHGFDSSYEDDAPDVQLDNSVSHLDLSLQLNDYCGSGVSTVSSMRNQETQTYPEMVSRNTN